ncbi:MAG: hypothetical protein CBE16_10570 [Rhodospirillaceae bacterium TMED256]|nr:MAG: hypothetical protein CBE16_10570 [Rhodospirillaceae bacterium TMED256]
MLLPTISLVLLAQLQLEYLQTYLFQRLLQLLRHDHLQSIQHHRGFLLSPLLLLLLALFQDPVKDFEHLHGHILKRLQVALFR